MCSKKTELSQYHGGIPVSYTHLDVYKRQTQEAANASWKLSGDIALASNLEDIRESYVGLYPPQVDGTIVTHLAQATDSHQKALPDGREQKLSRSLARRPTLQTGPHVYTSVHLSLIHI